MKRDRINGNNPGNRRVGKQGLITIGWGKLGAVLEVQAVRLSGYLNRKTKTLSRKKIICFLVIVCLLFLVGIYSCFRDAIIVSRDRAFGPSSSESIMLRENSNESRKEYRREDEVEKRIEAFEHYLDSLKRTDAGKILYDSIVSARPGLIDSLTTVRNLINSNK